MSPADLTALKSVLDIVLVFFSIIAAIAGGLGFLMGKVRQERNIIRNLSNQFAALTEHFHFIEDQSENRAQLARANLRLSFALAQELVLQGANGDLKRAVNDLRELVVSYSIPSTIERPDGQ